MKKLLIGMLAVALVVTVFYVNRNQSLAPKAFVSIVRPVKQEPKEKGKEVVTLTISPNPTFKQ